MRRLGLERDVVDPDVYRRTVERFREAGIVMPTFAQLADPSTIPAGIAAEVREVEPDAPHPRNLFRAHWYNGWGSPDPLALPGARRPAVGADRASTRPSSCSWATASP